MYFTISQGRLRPTDALFCTICRCSRSNLFRPLCFVSLSIAAIIKLSSDLPIPLLLQFTFFYFFEKPVFFSRVHDLRFLYSTVHFKCIQHSCSKINVLKVFNYLYRQFRTRRLEFVQNYLGMKSVSFIDRSSFSLSIAPGLLVVKKILQRALVCVQWDVTRAQYCIYRYVFYCHMYRVIHMPLSLFANQ